jgi:hypothetical protein
MGSAAAFGFALMFMLVPGLASAECNFESIPNGQWRLETKGGAAWLVTPCGERFFSVGINGLDPAQLNPPTHLPRTRHTWLPLPAAPESWGKSNLALIRRWGFNTVGGFSAPNLPLPNIPEIDLGWRADILWSDPFDPATDQRVIATAREAVSASKNSAYRIGYFPDNEIGWWNGALFVHYMRESAGNHTKQKLIALIRSYYHDDWRRFTDDFVVPAGITSFDDLLGRSGVTAQLRPGGNGIRVVRAWTATVAANYYGLIHRALREADPRALIFGDRLPIYYDSDAVRAETPYVDAIATNYNVDSPDGWIAHYYFDGLRKLSGNKPVLISEWFYAAKENETGNSNNEHLMTVPTQTERAAGAAKAARNFARIPEIVGIHWFQYYDEPKGGRNDGEDYDFGLLDRRGRPYEKLVTALAAANQTLAGVHREYSQTRPAPRPHVIEIPEANIDSRTHDLTQWPKDEALIEGLTAPSPEIPFGDIFLAWSAEGLHIATISMDYYDPYLLAYDGEFPLSEAFRIDLGVDAGAGARKFALFLIPPKLYKKHAAPAMRISVCRMAADRCVPMPSIVATYFGSDQPRITAQATLPWTELGISAPPRDHRVRLQIAATAFYRSRWMSLSGTPPGEAMKNTASWKVATLRRASALADSAN